MRADEARDGEERVTLPLDEKAIVAGLEEGGAVAERLAVFEPRASQLDLIRLVVRAFNEDAIAAAEAGTGVGKSFAYLLPAVDFALLNGERVVISTATITLQQQLFEKDIPLVAGALKKDIKAVLIKGRGNYLCRRRLADALRTSQPDFALSEGEKAEADTLTALAGWAERTASGSRSELSFLPRESVWSRVCSDADNCMGPRCHYAGSCFVQALRREAAAAQLLVVNHHLLFADLAARAEGAGWEAQIVLPPYHRVIIDEAHTIENAATSFFSKEWSRLGLFRALSRLYRERAGGQRSGLLLTLAGALCSGKSLEARADDWAAASAQIRASMQVLDAAALEFCGAAGGGAGAPGGASQGGGVFRFIPGRIPLIRSRLLPAFVDMEKCAARLCAAIRALVDEAEARAEEDKGFALSYSSILWEVKSLQRYLQGVDKVCGTFIGFCDEGAEAESEMKEVLWLERRASRQGGAPADGGGDYAVFNVTPLVVAGKLREALFTPAKTVVCVSATLTVGGSFDFWGSRTGALPARAAGEVCGDAPDGRPVLSGCFPSPFPYERSVLLAVPQDAPLPGEAEFQPFVNDAVYRLAEVSGGSALMLFTSFESLKGAYAAAAPLLEELGIHCLRQGEEDRGRLLRRFLDDTESVLFATDSFWEGVDAPGDTLRLVVICRLPFRIPNDPVFEARSEAIERSGGNPFMALSVPESVMKFRQGFGRLMRRSSDHGVVAVLDSRILRKQYGRLFLQSLPKTRTCFADFESVLRETERFLFS